MEPRMGIRNAYQPMRAAEYVRMSTEGQQYSIPYQQAAIRSYADRQGYTIVRTYADEGKSGLTLRHRTALIQLLSDVEEGANDFAAILVYDVSRWGRFQDTDEAGYYEYLCRKAGLRVEYCAEPFENDGGPLSAIMKNIKRVMAAEYSREQSERVHRATCRAAAQGYFTGGRPGYGYRRMLLGTDGSQKRELRLHEYKAVRDERMTLVLGPPHEVKTIRRIFRLFVERQMSPQQIAELLNREGVPNSHGLKWSNHVIRRMLANERYIGTHAYNLRSRKLKRGPRVLNSSDAWVRVPQAFDRIVTDELFAKAQQIIAARRHKRHTEESLLARLRYLLDKHGYLSAALIKADAQPDMVMYQKWFGGVRNAYARIGYTQPRDLVDLDRAKHIASIVKLTIEQLLDGLRAQGATVSRTWPDGCILVNEAITLAVKAMAYAAERGRPGWRLQNARKRRPTFTVVLRMDFANEHPLDFYLVPRRYMPRSRMRLGVRNDKRLTQFRHASFADLLLSIMARTVRS